MEPIVRRRKYFLGLRIRAGVLLSTWRVALLGKNVANAYCLPGGKIVVDTGILPLTENDAGLAAPAFWKRMLRASREGATGVPQRPPERRPPRPADPELATGSRAGVRARAPELTHPARLSSGAHEGLRRPAMGESPA
jgi:hypothetical protein